MTELGEVRDLSINLVTIRHLQYLYYKHFVVVVVVVVVVSPKRGLRHRILVVEWVSEYLLIFVLLYIVI